MQSHRAPRPADRPPPREGARPADTRSAAGPDAAARTGLLLQMLRGAGVREGSAPSPAARAGYFAPMLRARLPVDRPGDAFEQEAERTAERVVAAPGPAGGRCACGGAAAPGGECAECRAKAPSLQRRAHPGAVTAPPGASVVAAGLGSGGRPLDGSVLAFMEPRFGRDFGAVRVHTGGPAAESARALDAQAYTVGRDVVFGAGRYDPHGAEGRRLIAHELAHVVQQEAAGARVQRVPVARSVVFDLLDRLHTLWSLSNPEYGAARVEVGALPDPTESTALPPITARGLARSAEPHIAAPVANNFLGTSLTAGVGRGQPNLVADVLAIQPLLRAHGLLADADLAAEAAAVRALAAPAVAAPDAVIPATLRAIGEFKEGIARRRLGWDAIHADEQEHGGDRFAGRTFEFGIFSIFVPRGVRPDASKVHVFFSPGSAQGEEGGNAALVHGMRGASDASEYVLIGVPGREPGFVTITTADIAACLARVGRPPNVTGLRLSAHSRGYRGLRETVRGGLVDVSLVERVVIFDANYQSVAGVLRARGIPAGRITAYDVGSGTLPVPGSRTVPLPAGCMRAIGYSRLILDAMVTRPSLAIPHAVRLQLLPLPPRGSFTTAASPAAGKTSITAFCTANAAAVQAILSREGGPDGLRTFVDSNDLVRFGQDEHGRQITYPPGIYSHHFFVAEVAHEVTE